MAGCFEIWKKKKFEKTPISYPRTLGVPLPNLAHRSFTCRSSLSDSLSFSSLSSSPASSLSLTRRRGLCRHCLGIRGLKPSVAACVFTFSDSADQARRRGLRRHRLALGRRLRCARFAGGRSRPNQHLVPRVVVVVVFLFGRQFSWSASFTVNWSLDRFQISWQGK